VIDAMVRLTAYSDNGELRKRKDYLIDELIKTAEPDGYIGQFRPDMRVWQLWDVHEAAQIIHGLVLDYQYNKANRSLKTARALADYHIKQINAHPKKIVGEAAGYTITEFMAVTGLESALLVLHEATGEARYRAFCINERGLTRWDGEIVIGRYWPIEGHVYAYLARCEAQLKLHRIKPASSLLKPTQKALAFMTEHNGMMITGAVGQFECWDDTQDGLKGLGETCASVYLMRWLDEQLRMTGDSRYGDLIERVLFNAYFGAQAPTGEKMRYYCPITGPRTYYPDPSMCCPSNFRRGVADMLSMVYFRDQNGITVNQYAPGAATVALSDKDQVKVSQQTRYPSDGHVCLTIEPERPVQFALSLRIPAWCREATIKINGQTTRHRGAAFATITRTWKPGDQLELHMPMLPRWIKGRQAQAGRVALMYGPRVFCLNPSRNEQIKKHMDLQYLYVDLNSVKGPEPDDQIRPDGIAFHVKAWYAESAAELNGEPELELKLTEFPDPGGELVYFKERRPRTKSVVDDELLSGE
jgi:DUF1680 family protein